MSCSLERTRAAHISAPVTQAHHVVLADDIQRAVQDQKDQFPDVYRSSWRLTKLIACYVVGQIAREAAGDGLSVLDDPAAALADPEIGETLSTRAFIAAATMSERHDDPGEADDFKTDFKNEGELKSLGASGRKAFKLVTRMAADSS